MVGHESTGPAGDHEEPDRPLRILFDASDPPWLRPTRKLGIAFILAGAVLIVLWQGTFLATGGYRENPYDLGPGFDRASGFQARFAPRFFYFLYYTGNFSISTTQPPATLLYDHENARQALENNPHLIMEEHVFIRTGDLAKILFLFGDVHYIDIPFSVWLFFPVLLVLLALRATQQVVLLLFFVPTSLTALIVYSGGGFSYNSAFHLMLFALIFCWIANAHTQIRRSGHARAS